MKKIICFIIVFLIIGSPATVFAETAQAEPEPSFSVDTRHAYDGMEKSYAEGYSPSIIDGNALVVLPLIVQNVTEPLDVAVGLGDPSSSPFAYKNYQKQFAKKSYSFDEGTIECYLVSFALPLVESRVNGNYAVTFSISGKAVDGRPVSAEFTLYVSVTDGKDPNTPEPERTQAPQPQPKLMVESYSLDRDYLEAGGSAKLTVTVKNTSVTQKIKNVKLSFSEESGEILPSGTGAGYCKAIAKGGTYTWNVSLNAITGAQAKPHIASITMEYEDASAAALSATDRVIIQIRQPVRLEYEEPSLPSRVTQGDTPSFSMNLMNMGKSTLYNVLLKFDIPGLSNGGSVLVGTIVSGESKTGTTNFKIGKDILGDISGTLMLSYEDEYGEHYEKTLPLSTTIEKKAEVTTSAEVKITDSKAAFPWWTVCVGGSVILIAAICVFTLRWLKLKKERKRDEMRL
ncbi:MAG: hypothetical protein Q8O09_00495 [Bacillota bacterium]|nr:hypothetical protein [Bacillota bacterium]